MSKHFTVSIIYMPQHVQVVALSGNTRSCKIEYNQTLHLKDSNWVDEILKGLAWMREYGGATIWVVSDCEVFSMLRYRIGRQLNLGIYRDAALSLEERVGLLPRIAVAIENGRIDVDYHKCYRYDLATCSELRALCQAIQHLPTEIRPYMVTERQSLLE